MSISTVSNTCVKLDPMRCALDGLSNIMSGSDWSMNARMIRGRSYHRLGQRHAANPSDAPHLMR